MASVITLKGIDKAISNLNYRNKNSLKYRLVNTVRQFYENESSVGSMQGIDRDELVKVLWNTEDDTAIIKKKRKNLSNVKSSVNASLKNLYKEKKNPDGIIIGPANIFVMSDEAKDDALKAFKISAKSEETVSLGQIKDILNIVNEILSNPEAIAGKESAEGLRKFDQVKHLIQGLSEKVGLGASETTDSASKSSMAISGEKDATGGPDFAEVTEGYEDLEEIEVDDAIEEVEDEEDLQEVDVEYYLSKTNVIEGRKETDLLAGDSGEKYSDGGHKGDYEIRKARLLAEEFNNLLGVIDRYYNQYILIPEGKYIVGSKRPKKDEKPEQVVHLSPFYIGKFQVTNALFEIFIEKTGYRTTAEQIGYGTVYYGRLQKTVDEKTGLERFIWNTAIISKTVEGACWYQPLGRGSTTHNKRNHPVVQVSPEDAIAFAAWTGKSLPTEDEWEAASRTAKGYVFPWGNEWNKDSCNIEESYVGDTTPVDKYVEFANDYGIVDVIGNVMEWTLDRSEPLSSVKDRSKYFAVKGGSWISGNGLRLFSRFKLKPKSHSNILGFRCVAY